MLIPNAKAQSNDHFLDSLRDEVAFLIGDSWFVAPTRNGFHVTYCRSCKENYEAYLDSTNFFNRNLERSDFFQENQIDSICYYSTVSRMATSLNATKEERIAYYTNRYQANDILQFEIRFEKKWSEGKVEFVQSRNDELKDSILRKPLYKSNVNIFSDYRYWLPKAHWTDRTSSLKFYFERLPYSSLTVDYSIFIDHKIPGFFAEPLLVDSTDPLFFDRRKNYLEEERVKTLKIIALVLGIHDFNIVY